MCFPTSLSASTPLITTYNLLLHSRQFLFETRSAEKWRNVATLCASFRITGVPLWLWSPPYSYCHFCSIFLTTRYFFFWIVFEGIVDWRAKSDIHAAIGNLIWRSEIMSRVEEKRETNSVILNIDAFSFPISNSNFFSSKADVHSSLGWWEPIGCSRPCLWLLPLWFRWSSTRFSGLWSRRTSPRPISRCFQAKFQIHRQL